MDNLSGLGIGGDVVIAPPVSRTQAVWVRGYAAAAFGLDLLVAVSVFSVIYILRYGPKLGRDDALLLFLLIPVTWMLSLIGTGAYHRFHLGYGTEEYRAIGRTGLITFAVVAVTSYLVQAELSRLVVVPGVAFIMAGTLAVHFGLRRWVARERAEQRCTFATIAVGRADSVAAMIREFHASPESGYRVVAACVSNPEALHGHTDIQGVPVVGGADDTIETVDRLGADVVAVSADPDLAGAALRRLGWALADRDVELVVAPGIVEVAGPRLTLRPTPGMSVLHVERPADGLGRHALKRVSDLVLVLPIMLFALPVMAVLALGIKLTSPGPVFFTQERIGEQGRTFRMIKFRSMVVDAEQRLLTMAREGQVNAVLFKEKDDPRITPIGRFIRKFSLDELPQLFNVVKGDMSLVGPRPPLAREVALYEPDAYHRLRTLPGMTGLWQISGRSDLTWEQSLRLDLWYVDNWSPILDLQILFGTLRAVVGGSGAY